MANVYVDSNAAGAGTGADWANAYTTLGAATAAKAAGDIFWIAHNHAESAAAAKTIAFPGTASSPNQAYCVTSAGSVPPVSADLRTTATITTTGFSDILIRGFAYIYGVTFTASFSNSAVQMLSSAADGLLLFDQCYLSAPGTSSRGGKIKFGNDSVGYRQRVELNNTPLQIGNVSDEIYITAVDFVWKNTLSGFGGAVFPTKVFRASGIASQDSLVIVDAVDLSALGSGKTLVDDIIGSAHYLFNNCKLGASVTIATTPTSPSGPTTVVTRCDSGDTNYRTEKYRYEGTQTVETTVVRTGGASDGTTPIAWKLVTTANSKRYLPFEAVPIAIWNETTGSSITLTIEGIWGGGAVPTNADLWMDVEYLGTSGFPIGSFATSGTADLLVTGSNLTSSSETWGGSTTKFKMSVTITPQEKGPITVYLKAALASSTFYIDPEITVS